MLLKIVTTSLVVLGVGMVFAVPFLLGQRPDGGTQRELALFGARMLTYFGLTCFVWLAAATSSFLLIRRARREFLRDNSENVKELIEGTLRDHERKQ